MSSKKEKITSVQNQIRRYKEYIEEENPLMFRSIYSYMEWLPRLYSKLKQLGEIENDTSRIYKFFKSKT